MAPIASAQETATPAPTGLGIGLAASYLQFSDDFEGLDGGFGAELSARYTWYGGFQLLGGVHYSFHDIVRLPGNVRFLELFVDPRYVIELLDSQRIALLIAGRLAYARQSADGEVNASSAGFLAGGSVGGLYALRSTLAVEVTFLFGGLWLNRLQAEPDPPSVNGSVTAVQVGVVWSFPRSTDEP